ncbi:putative transcriptional regulator [Desulfosporosinus acidiphilus SJ4]|uniref:Putative transcriptional regulator n=1 Tax=Desulfosporosinus acidiphilus (strain DSM 22704 / JCM 16185 / SJ4) TaxID=646529 RepID=I4D1F6_DESAJ|nr:helix-turn-helix transcriptional regulator [Desulfosporosinus acidiphilus]AFM39630.1 putative transcriptional regulator [Desulfosporosinus acidiphilus SJ4]
MDREKVNEPELSLSMERVIQAELLLLLKQKPSHGYELIQRLNDSEFKSAEVDAATVYRNLRRMDKEGLINSQWEVGETGPGRRLYKLTSQGEESLIVWTKYIVRQKTKLENFLETYQQFNNSHPGQ